MDLYEIKKYPDPVLKQKCEAVEGMTDENVLTLNAMAHAMHHYHGIGLAGPQVGICKNLIVADIGHGCLKLANPEVLQAKGADTMAEGCLSLPGMEVNVERPYEIICRALNEQNELVEIKAKGLMAKVLQHEIDHLSGVLITDYLNDLEKNIFYKTTQMNKE